MPYDSGLTPQGQLLVDWSVSTKNRQAIGHDPCPFPWPLPPKKEDCHKMGEPSVIFLPLTFVWIYRECDFAFLVIIKHHI